MTAGRWKSSGMPARYTERQATDRGAVAKYYQERGGECHRKLKTTWVRVHHSGVRTQ